MQYVVADNCNSSKYTLLRKNRCTKACSDDNIPTNQPTIKRQQNSANLFRSKHDRNHAFGFGRLGALVDQDRPEAEANQARVACPDTCWAYDVGVLHKKASLWFNENEKH